MRATLIGQQRTRQHRRPRRAARDTLTTSAPARGTGGWFSRPKSSADIRVPSVSLSLENLKSSKVTNMTQKVTKHCGKCGLIKPIEDFARRRDRPCGRKSLCLVCDRLKARRYYQQHRAKHADLPESTERDEVFLRFKGKTGVKLPRSKVP